ncbi:MAG: hypothetical protein ACOYLB_15865 [Phototrophicaceae bacterium]
MLSKDFTLTKRHLGWLLIIGAGLGCLMAFSVDLLTIYRQVGFSGIFSPYTLEHFRSPMGIGLAQRVLLQACAGACLLGLTLLPLGNQPA